MREKRWARVIPVALIMYTIAFIDRSNISVALPSIARDLHMTPTEAGSAVGVFFFGYLALQIPGGYLASRWSAKRFVSISLVAWGVCAVATGLVHTASGFWLMRLLLGIAEGGVWPATLVLLANWFPRAERARANGYWMLCMPVGVIIFSPISGYILQDWNWRVLLICEGAVPFVWLLVWWLMIDDHPAQASWISPAERNYLTVTLAREARELERTAREHFLRVLLNRQVLLMVAIYFLLGLGDYSYLFWLPSALKKSMDLSNLQVGYLFAVPYAITAVGLVLVSRHSDRRRERRWHVAASLVWGGVFLLLSVATSAQPAVSFALVALVGIGSYGVLGPFWSIPTETLPLAMAGPAMGVINSVGNLGGYFGPLLVGYLNQRNGNFLLAFTLLSLGWLIAAGLTMFLKPARPVPAAKG